MTLPTAAAPRFAAYLAGAVMAYLVLWGCVRIAIAGCSAAAVAGLVLLCVAFLTARGRGPAAGRQALLAGPVALAAVAAEAVADGGRLQTADTWCTSAVACIALLLIWRRRHAGAWATMVGLTGLLWITGGVSQVETFGTLPTVLALGVIAAAGRALGWYTDQMAKYSTTAQQALEWRVAQDAYQLAHQQRIEQTGQLAGAMLQRIVTENGRLDPAARAECRLLHQTVRDETRGRLLLNDAVRAQVAAHRRRGATVQLLDDGHLARLEPKALRQLQNDIAAAIAPLTSNSITIRSRSDDHAHTVTIVATTSDPIAAALGQDDDEHVDLWQELAATAPGVPRR